jgi:hypothetical protein
MQAQQAVAAAAWSHLLGSTTSLLNMTPLSTRQSSMVPPGSFSI